MGQGEEIKQVDDIKLKWMEADAILDFHSMTMIVPDAVQGNYTWTIIICNQGVRKIQILANLIQLWNRWIQIRPATTLVFSNNRLWRIDHYFKDGQVMEMSSEPDNNRYIESSSYLLNYDAGSFSVRLNEDNHQITLVEFHP